MQVFELFKKVQDGHVQRDTITSNVIISACAAHEPGTVVLPGSPSERTSCAMANSPKGGTRAWEGGVENLRTIRPKPSPLHAPLRACTGFAARRSLREEQRKVRNPSAAHGPSPGSSLCKPSNSVTEINFTVEIAMHPSTTRACTGTISAQIPNLTAKTGVARSPCHLLRSA